MVPKHRRAIRFSGTMSSATSSGGRSAILKFQPDHRNRRGMRSPSGTVMEETAVMTILLCRQNFDRGALLCESIDRFMPEGLRTIIIPGRAQQCGAVSQASEAEAGRLVSEAEHVPGLAAVIPRSLQSRLARLWSQPVLSAAACLSVPSSSVRLAMARHVEADTLLVDRFRSVLVRPFRSGHSLGGNRWSAHVPRRQCAIHATARPS